MAAVVVVVTAGHPVTGPGLFAIGSLAVIVLLGWWAVERSAGNDPWRLWRRASGEDPGWQRDLDEARAAYGLRHHVPVGLAARPRIRDIAERAQREVRYAVPVSVLQFAVGAYWLNQEGDRTDLLLGAGWLVIGVVMVTSAAVRARWARRWLRDPPVEVESAGPDATGLTTPGAGPPSPRRTGTPEGPR
ncbi:hypothetical protein [Modestobacter sp. Leaf380]|uniref:hypothetical protein n=1 Tax=Modestobacter sp. Leaf380 TaxID=1736356 RepID=UPI0006FE2694|nr:hypothetical protein [Modestobacter sp. Leaf380]KQS64972.1 hypothetical protein ASG41_16220 [Modestobacter sp. Leaf380]